MNSDDNPDTIKDDPRIQLAIDQQASHGKLGCAAAFEIASELNVSPKLSEQRWTKWIIVSPIASWGYLDTALKKKT